MKKPECKIDSCGNSYKEWRSNGKLHREDGPAIEYADGGKSWWLYDLCYCVTYDSSFNFAKGFVCWAEAVKELQGKK